ncbi:MAG: App1 family protein [Actinomycetes bacterium]
MSTTDLKVHRAARVEDVVHAQLERRLLGRGWVPALVTYTGYGAPGWVRVMCRLVLRRPDPGRREDTGSVRGWRSFATASVTDAEVVIQAGTHRHIVRTDRSGYIDAVVRCDLPVGWREVQVSSPGSETASAPVNVIGRESTFGIISDIDGTVLVTSLPRPLRAAWNTFVLDEHARASVPGMAVLFERLVRKYPDAPVFYVSTGAWNVAPTLNRFLERHLYPRGPLLLTDWGPTVDAWFRSGRAHKRTQLRRLAHELPQVSWLLVGDDGQHDPEMYADFVNANPTRVAGVAIRQLTATEQVLSSGLPVPADSGPRSLCVPWVSGPNGAELSRLLAEAALL